MKGIIIYGNPMWGDNERATYCEFINEASFDSKTISKDLIGQSGHYIWKVDEHKKIVSRLEGEASEKSKAVCSKDDTYDFETGALIALMKMCGVEKVKKAAKETFFDVAENAVNEYEEEINALKEEIEKLKKEKKQIIVARSILNNKLIEENNNLSYIKSCNESTIKSLENTRDLLINKNNELIEENKELKLDCEKLCHGYVDTDMIFCGGRGTGKQYKALVELFKKLDKKKVQEAYKKAYGDRIIWCTSQPEVHPLSTAVLEGVSYLNKKFKTYSIEEWFYKIPTKREEMWEKIFTLHKESDVIIKVKREDIITFLHEIENRIPEITWASDNKIFETKYTIKDIFKELEGCDTPYEIHFRLWKVNKLSYSSDQYIYPSYAYKHIDYLPPMRWDLFKKGRLAVKVNYDNYKEFYEACEKELGRRPVTAVFTEDFTVSICKKDGLFEIFTIEDQKETGRKIVDWEDVR